jgi:hypothetical protein
MRPQGHENANDESNGNTRDESYEAHSLHRQINGEVSDRSPAKRNKRCKHPDKVSSHPRNCQTRPAIATGYSSERTCGVLFPKANASFAACWAGAVLHEDA